MSEEGRTWCQERGEVIPVSLDIAIEVDPSLLQLGQEAYGERFLLARLQWFKKPVALLQSPYRIGLWLDLDCEILGSLNPLFSSFSQDAEISLAREIEMPEPFETRYNGGVILFRHAAPCIESWARGALERNHLFLGDDQLLSHLIREEGFPLQELPQRYNWRVFQGAHPHIVILHWTGSAGKAHIRTYGGLKPLLTEWYGK
jgi:hypothetical protein